MKNKGFTVVELIITFVIVMTISIGLFKVVDSYRETQQKEINRKEVSNYRDEILKTIEDDVVNIGISEIDPINVSDKNYDQGIKITLKDGIEKDLYILSSYNGSSNAKVVYGDRQFVAPSKFIKISNDFIYDKQKIKRIGEIKERF